MEKTEYYQGIRRYVAAKVNNPADAEDLTQRVFLEFYNGKDQDDNIINPGAYLFGTARTIVANYYQQKQKQQDFLKTAPILTNKACDNGFSKQIQAREMLQEIVRILPQLPPKAKEAVELRLIENLSPKEAAQKANCSIDRFYERLHEGMIILRKKFQP